MTLRWREPDSNFWYLKSTQLGGLETGLITGHAGVPGLIGAFRQTGTAAVICREIQLKSRKRV